MTFLKESIVNCRKLDVSEETEKELRMFNFGFIEWAASDV
jgi:hypothetical protein